MYVSQVKAEVGDVLQQQEAVQFLMGAVHLVGNCPYNLAEEEVEYTGWVLAGSLVGEDKQEEVVAVVVPGAVHSGEEEGSTLKKNGASITKHDK